MLTPWNDADIGSVKERYNSTCPLHGKRQSDVENKISFPAVVALANQTTTEAPVSHSFCGVVIAFDKTL